MNQQNNSFCFCTLAFGSKYRLMAKELASDLEKYSPGTFLVIGTDKSSDFNNNKNIIAFKLHQQGILHCYNDRRFVIEKALASFQTVIHIDSDTKILGKIPERLEYSPGISGCYENLLKHISKYRQQDRGILEHVSLKLNINIENANWIGESLYIITKDGGKEQEFLQIWGLLASYLELKGMHSGDGNLMGLAAAKVGWIVNNSENWHLLKQLTCHLDASQQKEKRSFGDNLNRRIGYHYRLNKTRLLALRNFNFYYR